MSTEDKIVSLNDFKENRKLVDSDGKPYTGYYSNYYEWVNDQQEYYEEYYKKQWTWGVGPMFGFNGEYHIAGGLSLFSDIKLRAFDKIFLEL